MYIVISVSYEYKKCPATIDIDVRIKMLYEKMENLNYCATVPNSCTVV